MFVFQICGWYLSVAATIPGLKIGLGKYHIVVVNLVY